MRNDITQERQQAHALLDMLPREKLTAVRNLLEAMVEPLSRSLASAPVEDEEVTPEKAAALERARASLAGGEGVPQEDILREFAMSSPRSYHCRVIDPRRAEML
jgi:hypothetical protein